MPKDKLKTVPEKKFTYRYVSYRLRADQLDELKGFVGKDMSASKLMDQIIGWALRAQKGTKT